jgi:hypothetical protein
LARYAIEMQDEQGATREVRKLAFAGDDDAIDFAGWIDHPGEIAVWQGSRLVARFPPLRPLSAWPCRPSA